MIWLGTKKMMETGEQQARDRGGRHRSLIGVVRRPRFGRGWVWNGRARRKKAKTGKEKKKDKKNRKRLAGMYWLEVEVEYLIV